MQYGVDVPTYKRVNSKRNKKENLNISPLIVIIAMVAGVTLGRVKLTFVTGLTVAPFGIAYLLALLKKRNNKIILASFISIIAGYFSVYDNSPDYFIYPVVATIIFLLEYISNKLNKNIKLKNIFILEIIVFLSAGWLLGEQMTLINLSFSLMKAVIIIPCYYVIKYGVSCIGEIGKNYMFSMEELISIGILICLVVSGVGDFTIFNISIRNILALASVVVAAYAGGPAVGTVLGVSMGMIIGTVNNDMFLTTTLYSICGLMVGIFRETGKILSVIACLVCCFIVKAYANLLDTSAAIEIVVSAAIMLIVPGDVTSAILAEISNEEKSRNINGAEVEGVKKEFIERVDSLKTILTSISMSMSNISENERLVIKNKGTALVENLADRVCSNCELQNKCWGKEINSTYHDFQLVISEAEKGSFAAPDTLEKKCVKINTLLKRADELYNTYTVNQSIKDRFTEGRKVLAKQIDNMASVVGGIINEFDKDVENCYEVDKILCKTLSRNKIVYNEIYSFTDKRGHMKIKVRLDNGYGEKYCKRYILPLISKMVNTRISISEDKITINPNTNECTIILEENPKFHISSYAAFASKDGEKYSGDNFNYGKNKDGQYITVLSDGMGSGPEAGQESSMAIELMEKFMECGFDEVTALNTINSIMVMKFNETEKFTTMDMNVVDLYTGEISFVKAGGVISFIKNEKGVHGISCDSLPFGVADSMEVKKIKRKIKYGDIIITISDGILDVDKNNIGDYSWLSTYLEKATANPEELARDILNKAKELSGGRILDDMTVIVSKVYSSGNVRD